MTFWTYRDIPYSLERVAGSSTDWRWTVNGGEGVYFAGVSSSKETALERAFQTIDLLPGMPSLEEPRWYRVDWPLPTHGAISLSNSFRT
ncbi:hypothetical protein ACFQZO_24010 [Bradyrhizobium sp. GCM10027634]|uniref:hypothetical protein n=1 Tax=unclassified Bradyrhizobium TaxID=2631580 RepID=UPI00188A8981|nr:MULTISPECIES: hypothetical protein [unclassified Bradyrhizobium]MDN5003906.1 hypothetical protein [Bradyrhizobium sp. WYCCWR 12677]